VGVLNVLLVKDGFTSCLVFIKLLLVGSGRLGSHSLVSQLNPQRGVVAVAPYTVERERNFVV
jgi:hypothetical protein